MRLGYSEDKMKYILILLLLTLFSCGEQANVKLSKLSQSIASSEPVKNIKGDPLVIASEFKAIAPLIEVDKSSLERPSLDTSSNYKMNLTSNGYSTMPIVSYKWTFHALGEFASFGNLVDMTSHVLLCPGLSINGLNQKDLKITFSPFHGTCFDDAFGVKLEVTDSEGDSSFVYAVVSMQDETPREPDANNQAPFDIHQGFMSQAAKVQLKSNGSGIEFIPFNQSFMARDNITVSYATKTVTQEDYKADAYSYADAVGNVIGSGAIAATSAPYLELASPARAGSSEFVFTSSFQGQSFPFLTQKILLKKK